MHRGFIKHWRKMKDWGWYKIPHMVHLFEHLISEASHSDQEYHGIQLKRGQYICGRKQLCYETGISEQCLRTCITRLKSTNEITVQSTNKFSIITIVEYEKYQSKENDQPADQPTTNQQSTSNQPPTKNVKNVKNDKKRERGEQDSPTPKEISKIFFDSKRQQEELILFFVERGANEESIRAELDKFIRYWTELDSSGRHQRWEKQPTFEVKKRLITWFDKVKSPQSQFSRPSFSADI
jgi:hypothetical protein